MGIDPFLGEIIIVPFNFAPSSYAFCNGQLLPLSQNTALFALLGTTYGGDGKSTFALPDLQGRTPIHPGQGQGLSQRFQGEIGGVQMVTLLPSEIPVHTHSVDPKIPTATQAETDNPVNAYPAPSEENLYSDLTAGDMGSAPTNFRGMPAGGGLPHNNMQPSLVVNFLIALAGVFPQRP